MNKKFSFVAVCGEPNSGKSTLINLICGKKISIVSPKAHTTRVNLIGVLNFENTQLAFIDTPGILKQKSPLNNLLLKNANNGIRSANIIVFLIDATEKKLDNSISLLKKIVIRARENNAKIIVCLNKIDAIKKHFLLGKAEVLNELNSKENFGDIIESFLMISGKDFSGVQDLLKTLSEFSQHGNWQFENNDLYVNNKEKTATEITREKIFILTDREVPYGTYVENLSFIEKPHAVKIHQNIVVSKYNYKKIIIGNSGSMIKRIGIMSRNELEEIFNKRVQLFLFVKVVESWQKKDINIRDAGFSSGEI